MQIDFNKNGDVLILNCNGSFTFGDNQQFRSMLREINEQKPSKVSMNLKQVDFIDSAALGMLLLLRDTLQGTGTNLELLNPQGQLKKMFDLSSFNELFTIKH